MTVQSKATIKAFFQTGDKPTQAQFEDLIDSYQDTTASLVTLSSASIGAVGTQLLATATTAAAQAAIGGTAVGIQVYTATTTAAAQQAIGGGTVGRQIYEAVTTAAVANILSISSATTTTAGIIRIATSAQVETGTAADAAVVPSTLKNSIGYSRIIRVSAGCSAAGTATLAHGLGVNPEFTGAYLECVVSADNGFSVGDRLHIDSLMYTQNSVANYNYQYTTDATNFVVQFGAGGLLAKNKGTGVIGVLSDANWRWKGWAGA